MSVVAAVMLSVSVVLLIARSGSIVAVVLWGLGYSFNLNAGLSSLALIVPAVKLPLIMGLATTGQNIGYITVPLLYGYFAQYKVNLINTSA